VQPIALWKPRSVALVATAIATVAAVAWMGVALAAPIPHALDEDHDGLDDSLEQLLAETFAPVVLIEPGESNYPVSVDWILQRASLAYHEDYMFGVEATMPLAPHPLGSQMQLLGPPWTHPGSWNPGHLFPHCGDGDPHYQCLATTAADPDGKGCMATDRRTIKQAGDSGFLGCLERCSGCGTSAVCAVCRAPSGVAFPFPTPDVGYVSLRCRKRAIDCGAGERRRRQMDQRSLQSCEGITVFERRPLADRCW
jgi:hypothetical protein